MLEDSKIVVIFGGSGFLGRHAVSALAKKGYRLRIAVRYPELAGYLQPMGNVGQIQCVRADLSNRQSVARCLQGADSAVNLAGTFIQRGKQNFEALHHIGAQILAEEARKAELRRLIHISSLTAGAHASSLYARSKAAGEKALLHAFPEAIILRPSLVFGPEDRILTRFAAMARMLPVFPLIGGKTRFQPVFVDDVALAITAAIEGHITSGSIFELGGPEIVTLRDIVERVLALTLRKRLILPIPFSLAKILSLFLAVLPGRFLTLDQVKLLEWGSYVSHKAVAEKRTFEGIGVQPTGMGAILPSYLLRFRSKGEFDIPFYS